MKLLALVTVILYAIEVSECTLSPPVKKGNKKEKEKVTIAIESPAVFEKNKGPTDRNVFEKNLVIKDMKSQDVIAESGLYYIDTKIKRFSRETLGYITPWNGDGYDIGKTFHGKFNMISPVWLAFPFGNASSFQLSTHDVQKKWLKDIAAANTASHTLKILPRVLFEHWTTDDIVRLHTDLRKQTQLINSLVDTAKSFRFHGYVLEVWNQFVFSGTDTQIIISLIKSIAQKLKKHNLDIILAVPPMRNTKVQLFSRDHFDELAPHIKAFSLMTYDYSSIQRPGPNSPLNWSRQCVEMLVPQKNDIKRSQILLGINFYGYKYTPEGGGPIVGSQYLKFLETLKGKIQWDENSKEHFFELKSARDSGFVFYPTLYSLLHRLDLAEELGTGIAIWELGQGLNYFYDLL